MSVHAAVRTSPGLEEEIVARLKRLRTDVPPGCKADKYHYCVDYSIAFFEKGLASYRDLVRVIDFCGGARVLDLGCGPGHWCLAFLGENAEVHGIDKKPEFAYLGKKIAAALGLENKLVFAEGDAEALDYPDGHFDFVNSHGVIQFTDHELSFSEINRILKLGGKFYCGYTSTGHRFQKFMEAFAEGDSTAACRQLRVLLTQYAYEAGAFHLGWGHIRTYSFEALLNIARYYGFEFVARPNLQDEPGQCMGQDNTFDFVVEKARGAEDQKDFVQRQFAASGLTAREYLEGLFHSGLHRLAGRCIEEEWISPLSGEDRKTLTDLVRLKTGRDVTLLGHASQPARNLIQKLFSGRTRVTSDACIVEGLAAVLKQDYRTARACFENTVSWPYRQYMVAVCDLLLEEDRKAEKGFEALLAKNPENLVFRGGKFLCLLERGDAPAVRAALAGLT